MSSLDFNQGTSTNASLVNQILKQGQRLRNSMVQTILNNDPFNKELLSSMAVKGDEKYIKNSDNSVKNKVSDIADNYLQKNPTEKFFHANEILDDLGIKYDDVFKPLKCKKSGCNCDICKEYKKITEPNLSSVSLPRSELKLDYYPKKLSNPNERHFKSNSTTMVVKNVPQDNQILKYVDSLKIVINLLKLNDAGKRKVNANNSEKFSFENSTTYFVEYTLPEILLRNVPKTLAKVNSGLQKNKIRFCSKKVKKNTVLFKHEETHVISNIEMLDLNSIKVDITINFRSIKQKVPIFFGQASFYIGSILSSPYLSTTQDIHIYSERVPVILGNLNISLQLGGDKIHFGKDFIDAIEVNKSCTNLSNVSVFKELDTDYPVFNLKGVTTHRSENLHQNTERSSYFSGRAKTATPTKVEKIQNPLLYCYVHISEAQLIGDIKNTYLICYGIHREDIITSQIIYNTNNPIFNFYQLIPIFYDDTFLSKLQDKYILLEIWEKFNEHEKLIGITKLSLHRFYVIFRNPEVAAHLNKNQNPVIGLDWFEPIISLSTNKVFGQIKALLAIGTEIQINSLRHTLELKSLISKNQEKYIPIETPKVIENISPREEVIVFDKYVQIPEVEILSTKDFSTVRSTSDASTQSDFKMEPEKIIPDKKENQNVYENSTNVKNTTDLLDTLQKALSVKTDKIDSDSLEHFKANIFIDCALHLPSRKKCKSKRNKSKNKNEEILPSTYVTFKPDHNSDVIVTNVVAKTTSPKWEFRYDASLPVDLLYNETKRLLFKVWRRANATTLQPNFQTDIVLGFAALDLQVLLLFPNIQGWFNIIDFSNKCNGQIKIHVTPLENLKKYYKYKYMYSPEKPVIDPNENIQNLENDPSTPESFNRALKRKFTELEEITQRLKQRLSKITNDDSDMSDEFDDEFEKDLNTECIETEKVSFENVLNIPEYLQAGNSKTKENNILKNNETESFDDILKSITHITTNENIIDSSQNVRLENETEKTDNKSESLKSFDLHLKQEKSRIDSLLEKISSLTATPNENKIDSLLEKLSIINDETDKTFASRYVSGCSINNEPTENSNSLLKQFNLSPNLDPDLIFNPVLFQKIFSSDENTPKTEELLNAQSLKSSNSSNTSVESFSESSTPRQAPDGKTNDQ